MSFLAFRRAVALGLAIILCILRFWLLRLRGPLTLEKRALWVQQTCLGFLNGVGIHYSVEGTPPTHGLVVANHLSYLDILILSAAMPCFFVAKVEIGGWPFFGKAARLGGTIFLDRSSLASANTVAGQMTERLKLPFPVLLFPEGTSTDGTRVLRFHSRLIDPATVAGAQITAAAVRYMIEDGTPEKKLCWDDDTLFLTHLATTLNTPGFSAKVRFGEPHIYPDRRTAADKTHAEVVAMRAVADAVDDPEGELVGLAG
ncbi:MAG: lysophospholipid acyltransferase family protein [Terracidiphilus sp.]|jgi:1-acyl-sn-glycerol-3-phosphate acyltransferase